jgi:RNA polymerase sigma-70 factor (ECF subfamily)
MLKYQHCNTLYFNTSNIMKANFLKEKYLFLQAKNKDSDAYSQVYDLYAERIYRFIFFKVNKKEEAQDLTSEVFLKVWQYIIDGKQIKNLNAFFYQVARNLVIDYYRKSSQKDIPIDEPGNIAQERFAIDHLEKIEDKIQFEKIEIKLTELKDEYREVIILRYIEGLSMIEIADIIGKKKGNVRVILYRALNTLKELMDDQIDQ